MSSAPNSRAKFQKKCFKASFLNPTVKRTGDGFQGSFLTLESKLTLSEIETQLPLGRIAL